MLQSTKRTECLHDSVLGRGRTDDYASQKSKQVEMIQYEKNYGEKPVSLMCRQ